MESQLVRPADVRRSSEMLDDFPGVEPMSFYTLFATLTLSLTLLTSAVAGDDIASRSDPAWISFAETPVQSNREQEFHARATKNADPKPLKFVSAFVARSTDLSLLLVSYGDADLKFRTDQFLVTRIAAKEVTFSTGSQFPASVTRSLAKRFRAMGYSVKIVAPGELLRKNDSADPSAPEFVVPHNNTSPE